MKQCSKCKEHKSFSEFAKNKRHTDGLTSRCKKCRKEYYQTHKVEFAKYRDEYRKTHKRTDYDKKYWQSEKGKLLRCKQNLKRRYGLTLEDYDRMFGEQDGTCAICNGINKDGHRLVVDHDHETGKVRALLCHRCNRLIGRAEENIIILRSAINYIKSFET